jgi:hypothetical protein
MSIPKLSFFFPPTPPEDRLEKPRRLSDLARNCAIYALDWIVPTDIERGAIAVPESIKERAKAELAERGLSLGRGSGGARRGRTSSYDPLKSPPPEYVSFAEEAVGARGGGAGGERSRRETRRGEEDDGLDGVTEGKGANVGESEVR